jgi:hypothetical protein
MKRAPLNVPPKRSKSFLHLPFAIYANSGPNCLLRLHSGWDSLCALAAKRLPTYFNIHIPIN